MSLKNLSFLEEAQHGNVDRADISSSKEDFLINLGFEEVKKSFFALEGASRNIIRGYSKINEPLAASNIKQNQIF